MSAQTTTRRKPPRSDEAIPLGTGNLKRATTKPTRPVFGTSVSRQKYLQNRVEDLRLWAYDGTAKLRRDELDIPALQSCLRDVLDHLAEVRMDLSLAQDYKTPLDYAELQSKYWEAQQRAERLESKDSLRGYLVAAGWLALTATGLVLTLAVLFPAV